MAKERRPHAILIDINMPKMTGLEFIADLRYSWIETPYVFFTGFTTKEKILQSIRLGAIDFIEKPFQIAAQLLRSGKSGK